MKKKKKDQEIKHDNLEHLGLVNLLGTFGGNEVTKSITFTRQNGCAALVAQKAGCPNKQKVT